MSEEAYFVAPEDQWPEHNEGVVDFRPGHPGNGFFVGPFAHEKALTKARELTKDYWAATGKHRYYCVGKLIKIARIA